MKISKIPRERKILMKKRCEFCKKISRVSEIRHRGKIEIKLTDLEKNMLISFENERNLNESVAVSAIQSNPKYFYTYTEINAKVKAKIDPLIKIEVIICHPKTLLDIVE